MPPRTTHYLPSNPLADKNRPRIVGLDPGKTTGAVFLHPSGQWTITELDSLPALWDFLQEIQPKVVICERFVWQPRVHDATALKYIGVTELYVQQSYDVNMIYQMPSAAKNFVTDVMLRRNDMFNASKGMRHARDAVRHVVYYLIHVLGDQSWLEVMRG